MTGKTFFLWQLLLNNRSKSGLLSCQLGPNVVISFMSKLCILNGLVLKYLEVSKLTKQSLLNLGLETTNFCKSFLSRRCNFLPSTLALDFPAPRGLGYFSKEKGLA